MPARGIIMATRPARLVARLTCPYAIDVRPTGLPPGIRWRSADGLVRSRRFRGRGAAVTDGPVWRLARASSTASRPPGWA